MYLVVLQIQNGSVSSDSFKYRYYSQLNTFLYSDQTNQKYQTFTIQWYYNDICGFETKMN